MTLELAEDNDLPTWRDAVLLVQTLIYRFDELSAEAQVRAQWPRLRPLTVKALELMVEQALAEEACVGDCGGLCCQ